jgi:hypothetical protein
VLIAAVLDVEDRQVTSKRFRDRAGKSKEPALRTAGSAAEYGFCPRFDARRLHPCHRRQ